jgi:GTP diphosphokinase / guanosine-3',5'-bis(diphosphate) 3'-diphosphatase
VPAQITHPPREPHHISPHPARENDHVPASVSTLPRFAAATTPDADLRRLVAALHYAATQGDGIGHAIDVLEILAVEAGVTDADVLCAAVLQDTLADGDEAQRVARAADIETRFGPQVLAIALDAVEDADRLQPPRPDNVIGHARQRVHGAKLVQLADETAALREVAAQPWPLERRRARFDSARTVVEAIGPAHAGLRKLFDQASAARP